MENTTSKKKEKAYGVVEGVLCSRFAWRDAGQVPVYWLESFFILFSVNTLPFHFKRFL